MDQAGFGTLCDRLLPALRASGVFGGVQRSPRGLECPAKESGAPAAYRLELEGSQAWVSLVTADRWLSQSIELDLVHSGDKLEDLVEEELVELGLDGIRPAVEHFRSPEMLFTFRSRVPLGGTSGDAGLAQKMLLGYEACFRRLGDMEGGSED